MYWVKKTTSWIVREEERTKKSCEILKQEKKNRKKIAYDAKRGPFFFTEHISRKNIIYLCLSMFFDINTLIFHFV